MSKNSRSINLKNAKYKQKQSSNDMRERKYYKHSQGLFKRAKQDTDTEKRAGNHKMGGTEKQHATHEGKKIQNKTGNQINTQNHDMFTVIRLLELDN